MTTDIPITSVVARELFDSRGVPTIEADLRAGEGRELTRIEEATDGRVVPAPMPAVLTTGTGRTR